MEKIKVIIENNQNKIKIPTGIRMLVRRSCHAVLEMEGFDQPTVEICVIFTDNEEIRELNKKYFGVDEVTDEIAVRSELTGNTGNDNDRLGEIYISIEKVTELGKIYGEPLQMGMIYHTSHGVFELLGYGYTDDMAKTLLREKEADILTELGYPPLSAYNERRE